MTVSRNDAPEPKHGGVSVIVSVIVTVVAAGSLNPVVDPFPLSVVSTVGVVKRELVSRAPRFKNWSLRLFEANDTAFAHEFDEDLVLGQLGCSPSRSPKTPPPPPRVGGRRSDWTITFTVVRKHVFDKKRFSLEGRHNTMSPISYLWHPHKHWLARMYAHGHEHRIDIWDVENGNLVRTLQIQGYSQKFLIHWDPTGRYISFHKTDNSFYNRVLYMGYIGT